MTQGWMVRVNDGIALFRARWMVDLEGLASRIQTYIVSRLNVEPLELDPDLSFARSWRALGLATVSDTAMWSDRFRKIVLSHRAQPPAAGGMSVVLMPQHGLDLPCFYAELAVTATTLSAHIDLFSPFFSEPAYRARIEQYFAEVRQAHSHLAAGTPPAYAAELSSGLALSVRLPCEDVEQVAAALFDYLDRYLDAVLEAPFGPSFALSKEVEARSDDVVLAFTRTFQPHLPAQAMLERLFGAGWTKRYGALLFGA